MASLVDASGELVPTSAVLMASSQHMATRCYVENVEFLKCKKKDPNPEKCLEQGRQVTRCVLSLLRGVDPCIKAVIDWMLKPKFHVKKNDWVTVEGHLSVRTRTGRDGNESVERKGRRVRADVTLKELHQEGTKEMDAHVGCMCYSSNEFDLCGKEQQAFEKACPLE